MLWTICVARGSEEETEAPEWILFLVAVLRAALTICTVCNARRHSDLCPGPTGVGGVGEGAHAQALLDVNYTSLASGSSISSWLQKYFVLMKERYEFGTWEQSGKKQGSVFSFIFFLMFGIPLFVGLSIGCCLLQTDGQCRWMKDSIVMKSAIHASGSQILILSSVN